VSEYALEMHNMHISEMEQVKKAVKGGASGGSFGLIIGKVQEI